MGPLSPNPKEITVTKVISKSPLISTMKAIQMKNKESWSQGYKQ